MWWTPLGERTLAGAEAAVFRDGLGVTVDLALETLDEDDAFGFPQFDRLSGNARLALLAEGGSALLREEVPMPHLNSLLELTVAVVYDQIAAFVSCEVDDGDDVSMHPTWRQRILAACREREIDTGDEPPAEDCDDREGWEMLVDAIRAGALWDEDWLAEDEFLDLYPAVALVAKNNLNIADDYFRGVPPDPTEKELPKILQTLREITDSPVFHPDFDAGRIGVEDLYHGIFAGPCWDDEAELASEHPLVLHVTVSDASQFVIPFDRWKAEVKPMIAGVNEMLPPNTPLPPVSQEVRQALGEGLADGTRFERREKGYVILDAQGDYLTSTEEPVWSHGEDEDDQDPPPAYVDTPEAAWLGLNRADAVRQAVEDRRSILLGRLAIDEDELLDDVQ